MSDTRISKSSAERLRLALVDLVAAIDFEGEASHYDTVISCCVSNAREAIKESVGGGDDTSGPPVGLLAVVNHED
jgi:hypothetical protein